MEKLKRKIVKHGPSSLTISLPIEWTKKQGLSAGDEVDVEEKGGSIVVYSAKTQKEIMRKELDVSDFGSMIGRAIGALYKIGYDEVKLNYADPNVYEVVQNEFKKGLIGWEIIAHGKNHCIIKLVAMDLGGEFNAMLRREFLVLLSICEDGYDIFVNKNYDELKNIILRDMSINKFSDFCRRSLNKCRHEIRSNPMYYVVEDLEKLGDEYRDMNKYLLEKKPKLSRDIIALYKRVNDYFRYYYEMFFDFSPKKMDIFKQNGDKLVHDLEKAFEKHNDKNEIRIIGYLSSIAIRIQDINGALLTLKL